MTRKCIRCDEDLIPGEDWPESSQNTKLYVHKTCHKRHQKGFNDWRRAIEVGEGLSRAQYSELDREEQKRLRDKYKDTEPSTSPSKPRKPRNVREPKRVTRERTYWDDAGTLEDIHFNLQLKWGGCEFTGIEPASCNGSHILARELCYRWGYPEWVQDEENAIYIFDALNNAMYRQGFWLHPGGLYLPKPGNDYPEWMIKLGIPGKRIVMTEKRRFYASQAAPIIL